MATSIPRLGQHAEAGPRSGLRPCGASSAAESGQECDCGVANGEKTLFVKRAFLWLFGFGLSALLPLFLHSVIIGTFAPRPAFEEYVEIKGLRTQVLDAPEDKGLQERLRAAEEDHTTMLNKFHKANFFIGVSLGILAWFVSPFVLVRGVGIGLWFGGFATFGSGCFWTWGSLAPGAQLLALLAPLGGVIWSSVGHLWLSKRRRSTQST